MPNTARFPAEHRLRRGRFSAPGRIYLITTVVADRRPRFSDPAPASHAAGLIAEPVTWRDASLFAWVLMPEHLHCVVQLGGERALAAVVGHAKARISRSLAQQGMIDLPLWQRGYHDRALRFQDDLVEVVRYVIENPLRAGLAQHVNDYPWWGPRDLIA